MCLIILATHAHAQYPLILAGNRDEFYDRPAETASIWKTKPELIAGKDLKAGGTWLGISKTGKIAALTNHRDMKDIKENAPSRGHIVKNILTSNLSVPEYLQELHSSARKYNGFNLITGDSNQLYYFSSVKNSYREIPPGIYSISNAFLDTPWPKTEWSKNRFESIIRNESYDDEAVFELLLNKTRYPKEQLPHTGLPVDLEKAVSAVFIKTENYGTRCSTVVRVNKESELFFEERSFEAGTDKISGIAQFNVRI